jgi:outer membrane protein assembly factor BamE (lipoprotein component of BamABCDE complex)
MVLVPDEGRDGTSSSGIKVSRRLDIRNGGKIMFKFRHVMLLISSAVLLLSGCMSAAQHSQSLGSTKEREMTVGTVQAEIKKGMSAAKVAEVLGSPNIVTTDENGMEVWIYDKISTDVSYSRSSAGGIIGLIFGAGDVGGLGAASGSYGAGASSTTQRTLTVVIKYDAEKKVREFSYHASKF